MFSWLDARMRAADAKAQTLDGIEFVCELRSGADEADLRSCESALQRFLPDSYRTFLALHDGGFVGLETALAGMTSTTGIRIFSAAETAERTLALADDLAPFALPPGMLDGLIVFADYGNSDICAFDATRPNGGEYPVLDGFHEAVETWRELVIATSFEQWLRRIFDAFVERDQSPVYWLESPLGR